MNFRELCNKLGGQRATSILLGLGQSGVVDVNRHYKKNMPRKSWVIKLKLIALNRSIELMEFSKNGFDEE